MRVGFDGRWLHVLEPIAFNRYLVNLLRGLQSVRGLELFLFTDERRPIDGRNLVDLCVQVITLPSTREALWEHLHLPLALRRLRIDLYHASANPVLPGVKICRYVLTSHGAPMDYVRHQVRRGFLPGTASDYLQDLEPIHPRPRRLYLQARGKLSRRLAFAVADRIITVSQTTKRELVEFSGIREDKVRVTYLAPDASFRRPVSAESRNHVRMQFGLPTSYLLSVGTVARIKNSEGLLRVIACLRRLGITLPLVICAPTSHDLGRYRQLAMELGLLERRDLFFLEKVGAALPALYQGATAFVVLSWYESFSLPLAEAMACGLPIVASDAACLPEVLADGGILVAPGNTEKVALALKALLDSPKTQQELRERALRRSDSFSWEKTAQETYGVYKELVPN